MHLKEDEIIKISGGRYTKYKWNILKKLNEKDMLLSLLSISFLLYKKL